MTVTPCNIPAALLKLPLPWRWQQALSRHHLDCQWAQHDRLALTTRPVRTGESADDFELHLLLGHRYVGMCLWAAKSFLVKARRAYRVVLHDDGSLTDADVNTLGEHLLNGRIIRKREADEAMRELLAAHPACQRYRLSAPTVAGHNGRRMNLGIFAIKLFDFTLLSQARKILSLDTDILFFQRPDDIIRWIEQPDDLSCHYCLENHQPLRDRRGRLSGFERKAEAPTAFNSGLLCLPREAFDLDVLEPYIAQRVARSETVNLFEQQACNHLVSQYPRHGPLPASYSFNYTDDSCIATHFGLKALYFQNIHRIAADLM